MKIQYISDIHLEFFSEKLFSRLLTKLKPQADILVLPGDIGYPNDRYRFFIDFCSKNWKKTYFIAGNHEFYLNGDLDKTISQLRSFEKPNVKFLHNEVDYYQDVKFVGTTLWSNIPKELQYHAKQSLNDFTKIDWNVEKYNEEHKKCVKFLEKELLSDFDTIVISHHLPSYKLIHPCYENSTINYCFASHLDYLFKDSIKAWFFGHSHKPVEKKIDDVLFFSNPIGYVGENITFTLNKVAEVKL